MTVDSMNSSDFFTESPLEYSNGDTGKNTV